MKNCPKCGNQNDVETLFCGRCGQSLEKKRGISRKTKVVVSLSLLSLVTLGVIAFVLLGRTGIVKSAKRQKIESIALADNRLFQDKKYAKVYDGLAKDDRKQVTESEWVARSKAVEKSAGKLTEARVLSVKYLTKDKKFVMVELSADFSKLKKPIKTALFYVLENGRYRQTMMWGRTIEPDPMELR